MLVWAENELKNHLIWVSVLRLSRWLSQGQDFFALVQHVVPLWLKWPMAQLFPAAWADSIGQYGISFLDVYVLNTHNYYNMQALTS